METLVDWLCPDFPTSDPYVPIDALTESLKRKQYVVLCDSENPCYGVLTPHDIVLRPHKLAIDCLTKKEVVQLDDTYQEIRLRFNNTVSEALPVYSGEQFLGILEKTSAIRKMKALLDTLLLTSDAFPKLKSSLLHNLSHEIRTPLNHVLGFMNILSEMSQADLSTNALKYQHIVQHGSKRFLRFMNDLIDLSLCESGQTMEIVPSQFKPEELFQEVIVQMEAEMMDEFCDVQWVVSVNAPVVIDSDFKRLKQIFGQLLNLVIPSPCKDSRIVLGVDQDIDNQRHVLFVKTDTKTDDERELISSNSIFDFRTEFIQKMLERIGGTYRVEVDTKGYESSCIHLPMQFDPTLATA